MTLGIIGAILDGDDDRSEIPSERFQPLQPARRYWRLCPCSCQTVILHAVYSACRPRLLHLLRRSPRPPSRFSELRTRKLRSSSIRLLVLNLVRRTLRWMSSVACSDRGSPKGIISTVPIWLRCCMASRGLGWSQWGERTLREPCKERPGMTPGPVVDQLADHAREGPAGRRLGISRRNRHECCLWGAMRR
jgi:hypothetical protein